MWHLGAADIAWHPNRGWAATGLQWHAHACIPSPPGMCVLPGPPCQAWCNQLLLRSALDQMRIDHPHLARLDEGAAARAKPQASGMPLHDAAMHDAMPCVCIQRSIVQLALPSCMQAQDDDLAAGPGETALVGKGRSLPAAARDKLVELIAAHVRQDVFDGDWVRQEVAAAAAEYRGLQAFQRARSETDGQLYSQAYTRCRKRWVGGSSVVGAAAAAS